MAEALLQGLRAVSAGNADLARRALGIAAGLAPTGPTALLVLAGAKLLLLQSDEAVALYTTVVQKHDLREAWLGLAAARYLQGDIRTAADALGHVLHRHAVSASDFAHLGDGIASGASTPGWCALESGGRLVVRLPS